MNDRVIMPYIVQEISLIFACNEDFRFTFYCTNKSNVTSSVARRDNDVKVNEDEKVKFEIRRFPAVYIR